MRGVIGRWDVLANAPTVIQGWGWGVFFRAVFGRCPTFLGCCCALAPAAPVVVAMAKELLP